MPEEEKGTTVTGGRDASLVGKTRKRTLAETCEEITGADLKRAVDKLKKNMREGFTSGNAAVRGETEIRRAQLAAVEKEIDAAIEEGPDGKAKEEKAKATKEEEEEEEEEGETKEGGPPRKRPRRENKNSQNNIVLDAD